MLTHKPLKNTTVISISGYATSGKDTFAAIAKSVLTSLGKKCEIISFAGELKKITNSVTIPHLGLDCTNLTPEQKVKVRPILVSLGEGFRNIDEFFWVKKVRDFIESFDESEDIVFIIPDCRFENEAKWIHSFENGFCVTISRDGINAPNKQELVNMPKLISDHSDMNINWPNVKKDDVLTNETLRDIVLSTLGKINVTNKK